jgi:hypothetical protein
MSTREAIDTITGYFYQFDKTILEILQQDNPDASVFIEGIEDIDIVTADETSAIQCKYYAKTEYNHSVIKKPITLMLRHFSENRKSNIKYHLYGHYESGHEKLTTLTPSSLKSNFLTYSKTKINSDNTKQKVINRIHEELNLSDKDLDVFLDTLTIDIHAPSFEAQYQTIIENITKSLNVSKSEAELYHYNSALKVIKTLSIEQDREKRYLTKGKFLSLIAVKDEVFDAWFIKRKGRDKYIKSVKKEHLSSGFNMDPFNRFFLIDCSTNERLHDITEAILILARKWSKISKRQNPCFCPSIYLNGLEPEKLIQLKNQVYSSGIIFKDAYPFKGSALSSTHFNSPPSLENKVKFKLIDTIEDLKILIKETDSTVEIYQFYKEGEYFTNDQHKHVKIKIEDISYIKDLTK